MGTIEVRFWRQSQCKRVKHRNPIFDAALGVTVQSLLLDILHAWLLGLVKDFVIHAIWELVLGDAYHVSGYGVTQEVKLEYTLRIMKAQYDAYVLANPEKCQRQLINSPPQCLAQTLPDA